MQIVQFFILLLYYKYMISYYNAIKLISNDIITCICKKRRFVFEFVNFEKLTKKQYHIYIYYSMNN
jgi:hypothetical protein